MNDSSPQPAANVVTTEVPLCVDLDGTLTPVDTLHENLLSQLRQAPAALWSLPLWLIAGKAQLKRRVASRAAFDAGNLPLNAPLVAWLETERSAGRRFLLVTAADATIGNAVAAHVPLFDEVIASNGRENLSAGSKRAALVARFAPQKQCQKSKPTSD